MIRLKFKLKRQRRLEIINYYFKKSWQTNLSRLRLSQPKLIFDNQGLDKINYQLFKANIGLILLATTITTLFYFFLPPVVPLFYSAPWGPDQLAGKDLLFVLPIIMFLLTALALGVNKKLTFIDSVITRSLFGSTLLFNLILFIALVRIIWLII